MKRLEQREKRRVEILEVGLDLFIRKGYAATKTAEIAKQVGISEGLLFHYFETKEKLYLALIEQAVSGKDNIFSIQAAKPLDFFETTSRTILDYITKDPLAAKLFVLMSRAQYDEALPVDVRQCIMRQSDIDAAVEKIQQGQQDGSIRKGNPISLVIAFFMAIQGIAENVARHPEMPVPDPEWIVDMIRSKSYD